MKRKDSSIFKSNNSRHLQLLVMTQLLFIQSALYAQDGNAGINQANQAVRSYFDSGTNLMYAIGALLGLIGAVKVYQK
ncbi:DUF4134 family protein [Arachidicoccus sp.]|uniref:DUF4134 family protein n=1 Tax=Arachidicoccus sp. TaxID=1872624 RepID=UPI003D1DE5B7